MAVGSFVKSQLLEVIECASIAPEIIVYRFPVLNNEIKNGAQLIVREGQVAVFVSNGEIADVFEPGRYKLVTENIPVLTKINSWKHGFESPFKAKVYFVSSIQFMNIKWGTPNPVIMRDNDFGMVRIRAFGSFSFKVSDAGLFMKEIFGAINKFSAENISSYLKSMVVSGFSDLVAETRISALDLAAHYDELGYKSSDKMRNRFEKNGLTLVDLIVENISLPEEVEKMIDKRTNVGVMSGAMDQYAKIQVIDSIKDSANNPGGGGSLSGLGVALGSAGIIGETMRKTFSSPNVNTVNCNHCNAIIARGLKYCPQCGNENKESVKQCPKCSSVVTFNAKFCPDCGTKLFEPENVVVCKGCGKIVDKADNYCPDCGKTI